MNFFNKNKVLILGLLSAIILPVYDLITKGETHTKVLIFSAAVAATAFLARNLRGQWATIAGIVGTGITTYVSMEQSGTISWLQLFGQLIVLYLAAVAPPAKSRGYEHTAAITEARLKGEKLTPTEVGKK